VKDFAVEVKGLPDISDYKHEKILKALLWQLFTSRVDKAPQEIEELKKTQRYQSEIVDIFFGYKDLSNLKALLKIK